MSWADGITDGKKLILSLHLIAATARGAPEQFYLPGELAQALHEPWTPANTWIVLDPLLKSGAGGAQVGHRHGVHRAPGSLPLWQRAEVQEVLREVGVVLALQRLRGPGCRRERLVSHTASRCALPAMANARGARRVPSPLLVITSLNALVGRCDHVGLPVVVDVPTQRTPPGAAS